ncbi:MAG TPA: DUF2806 domain-containing protein [Dongiaceae bacterium]|nr:DUF2806 domain-containing protein [Dongiaceae bacterium]
MRKLWVHLTPRETFGLTSPDRVQRAGHSLGEVRRRELANLLNLERQLHELRRGHSSLDSAGKIIKSAEIRDIREVKFSSIIEATEQQEVQSEVLPDLPKMLDSALEVTRFDALERLLRLQKLCLLTERIILGLDVDEVDTSALDRRWFNRWKLNACEISNGALQQLWSRILVRELRAPGSTSLKALEYLAVFTLEDAENLSRLATWTLGDFIYRSAVQALPGSQVHADLFDRLEEQGILRGVFGKVLSKALFSQREDSFECPLVLADCQLTVTSPQTRTELHVPAYLVTRVGRELLSLVAPPADPDYLELVVQDLQARGMKVRVTELPRTASNLEVG